MPFRQTKHENPTPIKPSFLKPGDIFLEDREWEVYRMVRFQKNDDDSSDAIGKVVGYQRRPKDDKLPSKCLPLGEEVSFFGDGAYGPCLYLMDEYWEPEPSEIISFNG